MSVFVPSVAEQIFLLQNIITVIDNSPTHVAVHLMKAAFTPTKNDTAPPAAEADFTGYAAVSITAWQTAYLNAAGVAETVPTALASFRPTGTTITNTIYGYYMIDGHGNYMGSQAFDTPIALPGPTSVINLSVVWQESSNGWSATLLP